MKLRFGLLASAFLALPASAGQGLLPGLVEPPTVAGTPLRGARDERAAKPGSASPGASFRRAAWFCANGKVIESGSQASCKPWSVWNEHGTQACRGSGGLRDMEVFKRCG